MDSLVAKSPIQLSRRDIRAIILFQFQLLKRIKECHENFCTAFPNNKVSAATVKIWYREFKCGNFHLEDQPRPGPPSYAVTEGIVESIEDMVIADPNVTYEKIQHEIGISSGQCTPFYTNPFSYVNFVPAGSNISITLKQKQNRVKRCHEMFKKFNNGNSRDVSKIITGDETWIYHYDPETKQQSRQWCEIGEGPQTKVRRTQYTKKQMYAILVNTTGVKTVIPLEPGKTINSTWHTESCLPLIIKAINLQCTGTGLRGTFLHHDNARFSYIKVTRQFKEESGLHILSHTLILQI
ncbi:Mariner transposase [Oopsacas minuta]|uniref:Mariner transposase n=1 Tax=Oopsacas minuta TaxID=111878 RepID=A0AAV7JBW3_9METZ|nr:Mariner transposase [Oopsacas minuta]